MTSGVNVNGTNDKAKAYVLQGGTLNNKKLREGVGEFDKSYSTLSPSLRPYNTNATAGTAGLKPMPGITSIDIKSKSAYGSLREVTVNFVCYNIQQLEDLELLYMRPGYTVLIEWGWAPYLDNSGNFKNTINFYDGVLKGGVERDQVFSDLFQRSKDHFGNYDALYGYVKNYNWTARMDGGYDCQTTIISIGEILESLKISWLQVNASAVIANGGIFNALTPAERLTFDTTDTLIKSYSKNILTGICYELYSFCFLRYKTFREQFPKMPLSTAAPLAQQYYDYDFFVFPYKNNINSKSPLASSGLQAYITLRSFIDILNKYVLLYAGTSESTAKPFIELSTHPNKYDDTLIQDTKDNPENSLLCLAHPLQVSVDPTVCLITNSTWAKGIDTSNLDEGDNNDTPSFYDNAASNVYNDIKKKSLLGIMGIPAQKNTITEYILSKVSSINDAKEFVRAFTQHVRNVENSIAVTGDKVVISNESVFSRLNVISGGAQRLVDEGSLDKNIYDVIFDVNTILSNEAEQNAKSETAKKLSKDESPFGVQYLTDLQSKGKPSFEYKNELGKISNIYLNLDKLYQLSLDSSLYDKNQELNIFYYLKQVLKEVQDSIGGVNNFEIHVDPIDSVARIIDLNYIDYTNRTKAYSDAFQIEMQNTSGTVRSYSLQSQIFPEQASLVSIGAQVGGGGTQASQNNTLLDFNNNLTDRIITIKIPPTTQATPSGSYLPNLIDSFNKIKSSFFPPQGKLEEQVKVYDLAPEIDQNDISQYKTALKDIITYFQGVTNSNTKNRAIIPVKISLTMDGIGGLIIGHLFKIPPDLLPKGYKSDTTGGKLLQVVTGINHKVENGDWTTTIDAYNIVTNKPSGVQFNFKDYTSIDPETGQFNVNATPFSVDKSAKDNVSVAVKFFLNQGYSKEFVAALIGSFLQESTLNPKSVNFNSSLPYNDKNQTYAAGIAQWVGPRRVNILQYAKSSGINIPRYEDAVKIVNNATKTPDSANILKTAFNVIPLQTQLSFTNQELSTTPGFSNVRNTNNLSVAANWLFKEYERGDVFGKRGGFAETVLQDINAGKYTQARISNPGFSPSPTTPFNINPIPF